MLLTCINDTVDIRVPVGVGVAMGSRLDKQSLIDLDYDDIYTRFAVGIGNVELHQ